MFYLSSLILLAVFIFDGYFEVYEASMLLLLYVLYIVAMRYNKVCCVCWHDSIFMWPRTNVFVVAVKHRRTRAALSDMLL